MNGVFVFVVAWGEGCLERRERNMPPYFWDLWDREGNLMKFLNKKEREKGLSWVTFHLREKERDLRERERVVVSDHMGESIN